MASTRCAAPVFLNGVVSYDSFLVHPVQHEGQFLECRNYTGCAHGVLVQDPLMVQLPIALAIEPRLLPYAEANGFHMDTKVILPSDTSATDTEEFDSTATSFSVRCLRRWRLTMVNGPMTFSGTCGSCGVLIVGEIKQSYHNSISCSDTSSHFVIR